MVTTGVKLSDLIRRPELSYEKLASVDLDRPELPDAVKEQVEIQIKYEGYIARQMKEAEQFKKMEEKSISASIDYDCIQSLRLEARQKLKTIKPLNLGQASRISGVSPADITALIIYLEQHGGGNK